MEESRPVEVVFGTLKQTVFCRCAQSTLKIFGFVPSDQLMVFESITPIKLAPDGNNSLMLSLVAGMERNSLDAVVFAERDMLIRARAVGDEQQGRRLMLFLCVPKRPVFNSSVCRFSYPSFSLLI